MNLKKWKNVILLIFTLCIFTSSAFGVANVLGISLTGVSGSTGSATKPPPKPTPTPIPLKIDVINANDTDSNGVKYFKEQEVRFKVGNAPNNDINNVKASYSIDGAATVEVKPKGDYFAISIANKSQGTLTLNVSAQNRAPATLTFRYLYDNTPPVIGDPSNQNWTQSTDFKIQVSDSGSGIKSVTLTYDNGNTWLEMINNLGTYSYTLPQNILGNEVVTVRVFDKAGNTVDKKFDFKNPVISSWNVYTGPSMNSAYNGTSWTSYNVRFVFTASDNISLKSISYKKSTDSSWTDVSGVSGNTKNVDHTVEITSGTAFNGNISFRITDAAGNSITKDFPIKVDKIKPVIVLNNPAGKAKTKNDVTVTADISDKDSGISTYSYTITNSSFTQTVNNSKSVLVNREGVNTITFTATDNAGNKETQSTTVTIDKTGPTIILDNTFADGAYTKPVTIKAKSTDADVNQGSFRYKLYKNNSLIEEKSSSEVYVGASGK